MTTVANVKEILAKLISFDTTSHLSNLECMEYIQHYLEKYEVPSTLDYNEDRTKANLLATIGDSTQKGIVLSGHTDVVPVTGQHWTTDPFTLVEKDGKWFGRGTADMKSFIAICLAFVPEWAENPPATPIHLAFSYDEEVGCLGAPSLLTHMKALGVEPELALIGEPTGMQVVDAHKSIYSLETIVYGHEAHSSDVEHGVNSIMIASQLITHLTSIQQRLEQEQDDRFKPPFSTIQIGTIEGGTARNIIPRECRFFWEIRSLPHIHPKTILAEFETYAESLLPAMKSVSENVGIETILHAHVPSLDKPSDPQFQSSVMKAAKQNQALAVSFGTEAGMFNEADMETYICGPGHIKQAHKPDEFIEVTQIEECVAFIRQMVDG